MYENSSFTHISILFLLILLAANLLVLDLKIFSPAAVTVSDVSIVNSPTPDPSTLQMNNSISYCPASCLSLISQATQSANIGSPAEMIDTSPKPVNLPAREYYVPLGNGSTDKSYWDDQTATETVIDPANYGRVTEAYFIASLKNPTQNGMAEAQLYNVTDKHPVWGSHVIMNGPLQQTISSGKIVLDSGSKLYRVQLKSSLNYPISLENAKVRIIAQ